MHIESTNQQEINKKSTRKIKKKKQKINDKNKT